MTSTLRGLETLTRTLMPGYGILDSDQVSEVRIDDERTSAPLAPAPMRGLYSYGAATWTEPARVRTAWSPNEKLICAAQPPD